MYRKLDRKDQARHFLPKKDCYPIKIVRPRAARAARATANLSVKGPEPYVFLYPALYIFFIPDMY